tara:strand:- start:3379 stop:5196 length:1818 start_codon:yes stop_codon:yes gene_type:complete
MKYVNFKTVSIKNFLSVGEEPVTVDFKPGLHVITGTNKDKLDRRNGVGKSTIADAIHFAIFGSTIRELKKENIVHNLAYKGCEVVLEFEVIKNDKKRDYKVVRMLEPSRCRLYVDGEDKTRDSISNTTEYICSILSASTDIFQNCVIMTLNNTIPFMAKKKVEKRKFVEGIFNLEVFSDMLSLVRSEHNDTKRTYEVEGAKFEEVDHTLSTHKEQKAQYVKEQSDRKNRYEQRKIDNTEELDRLQKKLVDINTEELEKIKGTISTIEQNLDTCNDKITKVDKEISTYETEIRFVDQQLSKIGTDKDECPVCLRPVTDHDRSQIEEEKVELQGSIDAKNKEIEKCRATLLTLNGLKSKLKLAITNQNGLYNSNQLKIKDNDSRTSRMNQLKEWNKQLDQDLKNFDNDTDQHDKLINSTKKRLEDISKSLSKIRHTLSIVDVVKFVVSEEGVKSYIVKKILQVFNSKLQHYLQLMDANCCCIFNEYFEEEIVTETNKECSYFNFSGAERKNIDLSCLFAFMDIRRLQGNVAYNISIYDELLDTSLDEKGVELVLNILRERVEKHNECVMVISHRKESVKIGSHYANPGEVIFLEKENGVTRRVEFKD